MPEANEKDILLKLAFFNPDFSDKFGNQIIDYLVLDSLSARGPLLSQIPPDIKAYIKEVFKLDFEEAEITAAGKRLGRRKLIEYKPENTREDYPSLKILSDTDQQITSNVSRIRQLENRVIDDWKEELCKKYNNNPQVVQNLDILVHYLQVFLSKVLYKHGIECVSLLYPQNEDTNSWIETIQGNILDEIRDEDEFVNALLKIEITGFLTKDDEARKNYLTSLFNSSFFWHLIQVDDDFSRLLRDATSGQMLFLDANILYGLVGFGGSRSLTNLNNLIKFAQKLKYTVLVTSKTVDEFHFSVNNKFKEQRKKPIIPRELVKIAVEQLDNDSILVNYWTEYAKTGLTIEDFISEKSHVESILAELNIRIYDKNRKDIESSDDLKREESILRTACGDYFNPNIVEHDAFHRLLIIKLRKTPKYNFNNAVAWFLTQDSKLLQYSKVARKGNQSLPFCITSDQWIQINRPFLARTVSPQEYEDSFYALVTQPYLRSFTTLSLEDCYEKVLNRLARFENMNPKFAFEVVTDRHFMVTLALEKDETKIEEKLNNKFVDIARELNQKKEELEKEVQQSNFEPFGLE